MKRAVLLLATGVACITIASVGQADSNKICAQPSKPCGYYECYPNPPGSGKCTANETFWGGGCYSGSDDCVMSQYQCATQLYSGFSTGGSTYTCEGACVAGREYGPPIHTQVSFCPNPLGQP
jgi:hypothetical protein